MDKLNRLNGSFAIVLPLEKFVTLWGRGRQARNSEKEFEALAKPPSSVLQAQYSEARNQDSESVSRPDID
jgi:hypothetical protein